MARSKTAVSEQAGPLAKANEWNVLTTPWLEVMDLEARPQRLSVLESLRTAAELHQIVSPSPLDLFAAHRFLLTLLYWQSPACGGVEKLRKSLLAGKVPSALIKELSAEEGRFNLFDPKKPFLQDPTVRDAKGLPASSLFSEMASGTNVAHFHHGDDDASRLCLRCATLGLLRLVPWTQSGGAGKQPAVHGAPPIMPLAIGETLCEILGLNLIPLETALGSPQWTGHFTPLGRKAGIQLLEGLTWNPRRVHLLAPADPTICCQCGESSLPTVGPIVYEKNPACKQEGDALQGWRDPAAFYKPEDHRTTKTSRESDAALGDDLRRVFVQQFGKKTEPAPVSQVVLANPGHHGWLVVMPCTNPANNKSYDHRVQPLPGLTGDAPKRATSWDASVPWQAGDERRLKPQDIRRPTKGMYRFVSAAAQLDGTAWGILANAAGHSMDEDPAAFDIFTGIYWPLRNKHSTLPSRNAAWMALKLMATAGRGRPSPGNCPGSFRPWMQLSPAASPAKQKRYPRAIPTGSRLEAELREIIRKSNAESPAKKIDWPGLCQFLNEVTP
jgi:hypothetical protein